jgi:hypothetical protein
VWVLLDITQKTHNDHIQVWNAYLFEILGMSLPPVLGEFAWYDAAFTCIAGYEPAACPVCNGIECVWFSDLVRAGFHPEPWVVPDKGDGHLSGETVETAAAYDLIRESCEGWSRVQDARVCLVLVEGPKNSKIQNVLYSHQLPVSLPPGSNEFACIPGQQSLCVECHHDV